MFSIKIISAKCKIRLYKIWRYLIIFLPYIIDFWNSVVKPRDFEVLTVHT